MVSVRRISAFARSITIQGVALQDVIRVFHCSHTDAMATQQPNCDLHKSKVHRYDYWVAVQSQNAHGMVLRFLQRRRDVCIVDHDPVTGKHMPTNINIHGVTTAGNVVADLGKMEERLRK